MLSSDENIETIGQLLRVAQHYFGLQSEYIRLDVIHKVVKVITLSAMVLMVAGLLVLALIYFSFAAAFALSTSCCWSLLYSTVTAGLNGRW